MKERPIIFNSEMVRAILDGRKTQTRRVIKPQPEWAFLPHMSNIFNIDIETGRHCYSFRRKWNYCPYGQPGDRLSVEETWAIYMSGQHSRINLEIMKVRLERVHDISEEDAQAEGLINDVEIVDDGGDYRGQYATDRFVDLWDSMCPQKGPLWGENPWVWVIEFKRLTS